MRDLRRFRRFVTERYRLSPLEVETPVVEEFSTRSSRREPKRVPKTGH